MFPFVFGFMNGLDLTVSFGFSAKGAYSLDFSFSLLFALGKLSLVGKLETEKALVVDSGFLKRPPAVKTLSFATSDWEVFAASFDSFASSFSLTS